MQDIKSTTEKNGPASRAILMTMQIRWYGAERITQYGRSRATLDATGRHHLADAIVIEFGVKNSCGVVEIAS